MMKTVGKDGGRFIIASGKGVNPGRLAAGAPGVELYRGGVFSDRINNPAKGNRPGGLIDKQQQMDPRSTKFAHPFDNGDFRSTATNELQPAVTYWNVIRPFRTFGRRAQVPEISPHEHGKFFRSKIEPQVKTVFGAAKSGKQSDTAFHPNNNVVVRVPPVPKSAASGERKQRVQKLPSFESTGNLWNNANHSFIEGHPNPVTGQMGVGRWQTVKRSVV